MAKARIKKGEMVIVIAGKGRDLEQPRRVLQVMPSKNRVLVEGANTVKKHERPNPQKNSKGGILEREASIHVSNVMPVDPKTGKHTRVGTRRLGDGRRVRVAKRSGEALDK
jgi:large subunit ribosomal protein L24